MAYFIFLKYLDSLEDVRKNPHVKFLPKSPCAIFQTSTKFLKSIEIRKEFFLNFGPFLGFDPAAAHLSSPPRRPTNQPAQWPSVGPPDLPLSLADVRVPPSRLPPRVDRCCRCLACAHAASAPVMAGAPTPHHSPPPPRRIPFRNSRLHSIMVHHRRRPFPSDTRPPAPPPTL
jgi:hypothetical protein